MEINNYENFFYTIKWDVYFENPLPPIIGNNDFTPFYIIDKNIVRPDFILDIINWGAVYGGIESILLNISKEYNLNIKGEIIGYVLPTDKLEATQFPTTALKININNEKVTYKPCTPFFDFKPKKRLEEPYPNNLHIIKWDIRFENKLPNTCKSTDLDPCNIEKKQLLTPPDVFEIQEFEPLKEWFETNIIKYCREKKVKIKGEILGELYENEYPKNELPVSGVKFFVSTSKFTVSFGNVVVKGTLAKKSK